MKMKKLGPLGAVLSGVNFSKKLDPDLIDVIKKAFLEDLVIIFRNVKADPKKLISIANIWGKPTKHPLFKGLVNFPEIIKIENYGKKYHTNAHWHSDVTFERYPPDITLLYALEVPKKGGNTLFSNQYLAYELLPERFKRDFKNYKAIHSNRNVLKLVGGKGKDSKSVLHPIFRTHPETNRKALYLTEAFVEGIEGLDKEKSKEILEKLYIQSRKIDYRYEHLWKKGDLVMWDNRCVQHYAIHDYGKEVRSMHRITISI